MNPLFHPAVNYVVRHAMRPLAGLIPHDLHPRVTGTLKVRVPGDGGSFRMAVNPTSYLGKVLFFRGMKGYEWPSVRVLMALAARSRTFLDVGANIGYYSLVAAACNPSLRIVSFEPLPSAHHFLQKNIGLNGFGNITPSRFALSNEAGERTFYVSKDPAFSDIEHHLTTTGGFDRGLSSRTPIVEKFVVETETMDAFVAAHLADAPIDLVKIDTESSEHLVLQGATKVLATHRPTIFCEVLPEVNESALEAIFSDHGYQMFRPTPQGLVAAGTLKHRDRATKDHVMVHPDRLEAVRDFLAE